MSTTGLAVRRGESRNERWEEKRMGSEFEEGVRAKVLHPRFRAQSLIKILVIGLAGALRLKSLFSSCCC